MQNLLNCRTDLSDCVLITSVKDQIFTSIHPIELELEITEHFLLRVFYSNIFPNRRLRSYFSEPIQYPLLINTGSSYTLK